MNDEMHEVLSAFFDGESVDRERLAEAMDAPEARDALFDIARLRAELQRNMEVPGAEFYRRMEPMIGNRPGLLRLFGRGRLRVQLAVAASLLAVAIAGFWLGSVGGNGSGPAVEGPPIPDRIIAFEPGKDWSEVKP